MFCLLLLLIHIIISNSIKYFRVYFLNHKNLSKISIYQNFLKTCYKLIEDHLQLFIYY